MPPKIIDVELSKEDHNKMAIIENLVWEVAKILSPNEYIDPKKVNKAKNNLINELSPNK